MNGSLSTHLRCWSLIAALVFSLQPGLPGEIVPVRHVEGTIHGFLVLRSQEGHVLAVGDLVQIARGNKVTSHLVFRFKDGSLDDETTVSSQRGTFQLISDHHIQKGPSYPHPMDVLIDVRRGQITSRTVGKDGKEEIRTDQLVLPPDLANGLVISIARNIQPDTPETKVSMLVATPKPRLIKLAISPRGEEPFSVGGSPRKAMRYEVRIELGGVAGVVAPLIGKQPPNPQIWIDEGPAPAVVKEEGPLYEGGPIWIIEQVSPAWPPDSPPSGI